ncbi:MAG TPA: M20/M25/M40 family metallo-hydrolase [Candidatus Limnocylindrales bacterium]
MTPEAPAAGQVRGKRPSDAIGADGWAAATDELVATLRHLIRIPSINPPDPPGAELEAANWIAAALQDEGLRPEVLEPVPGRGSVAARLLGDGSGGDPLLLLAHVDVVPAPADEWTHDPFAADVADGYVWGRGAVDMKNLLAMEIEVVRLLAREARAAGRDPASDPIPGLTRDILFVASADEEAGGIDGASWIVNHRPELVRAAGAINESGAIATPVGGRTFYPIMVAEKGYAVFRITVHGTWGHGSMPRDDNAAVLASEAVRRLAVPGEPRITTVMETFLRGVEAGLPPRFGPLLRSIAAGSDPSAANDACDLTHARALRALVRNTISTGVLRAGVKYNVIPGKAQIEIDCRQLPGTSVEAMRQEVLGRLGDLGPACDVELLIAAEPVEASTDTDLYRALEATLRDHDPDGVPLPVMAPFATDGKHLVRLGVPSYGFSPLQLEPAERYLDRFHGVDERVGIDALRWGLPVLYDAVRRFCGPA